MLKIKNPTTIVGKGIEPEGTFTVSENGTYDVATYAKVRVDINAMNTDLTLDQITTGYDLANTNWLLKDSATSYSGTVGWDAPDDNFAGYGVFPDTGSKSALRTYTVEDSNYGHEVSVVQRSDFNNPGMVLMFSALAIRESFETYDSYVTSRGDSGSDFVTWLKENAVYLGQNNLGMYPEE